MSNCIARKIKPKVKGYRGKEPFLKNGQMIHWDSFLERDYIRLADFDLEVEEISAQPICISFLFYGRKRKYFPDFKVITRDNRIFIIEVKPSRFVENEENKLKFDVARRFCREKGWTFLIFTENEIRPGLLQSNLDLLRALGAQDLTDSILDSIVMNLRVVVETTIEEFRVKNPQFSNEDYYAALYQLIYFQEIETDLVGSLINGQSRIRIRGDSQCLLN